MQAKRLRLRIDVLALIVAVASLGWQITDAIQKQREHISGEVTIVRQPLPGRIDVVFTIRNPGSRSVFIERCELRESGEKNAGTYRVIPWTSAPSRNVVDPGQSVTAVMTVKSLDELKDLFQIDNYMCFAFQSQGGATISLWMDEGRRQRVYADIAFKSPKATLNYRAL